MRPANGRYQGEPVGGREERFRLEWVVHGRMICCAERRLYNPHPPPTSGRVPRVVQRPLDRNAGTAPVGELRPLTVAARIYCQQPSAPANPTSGSAEAAPARRGGRSALAGSGVADRSHPDQVWCCRSASARHRIRAAGPRGTVAGRGIAAGVHAGAVRGLDVHGAVHGKPDPCACGLIARVSSLGGRPPRAKHLEHSRIDRGQ